LEALHLIGFNALCMQGKSQCVLGSAMRKLILNSEVLLNASIDNGVAGGWVERWLSRPGRENEYFKRKYLIFRAKQIFK
jgi:hypothetical protein